MEKSTVEPAKMFDYKIEGVDMDYDVTKKTENYPEDIDDCETISSSLLFLVLKFYYY